MFFEHVPKRRPSHVKTSGSLTLIVVFFLQDEPDNIVLNIRKALAKIDQMIARCILRDTDSRLFGLKNVIYACAVNKGTVRLSNQCADNSVKLCKVTVPRKILH